MFVSEIETAPSCYCACFFSGEFVWLGGTKFPFGPSAILTRDTLIDTVHLGTHARCYPCDSRSARRVHVSHVRCSPQASSCSSVSTTWLAYLVPTPGWAQKHKRIHPLFPPDSPRMRESTIENILKPLPQQARS